MDKNEIIWVSKEFAERFKKMEAENATIEQQDNALDEYMDSVKAEVKRDFKASLESLDEDAAIFAGMMLRVKQAFGKAKDEHLTASYELWEKFEEEIPSVRGKIDSIIKTLKPLEEQLTTINGLIGKIRTYDIDKFTHSIECLATAYGTQKEMVEFLVKHFGKET